MKVRTEPVEQKPDVVVTMTWEEAIILRSIVGRINGISPYRDLTSKLFDGLLEVGVEYNDAVNFHGCFE